MTVTLMDLLMILSLGILAGTGSGLVIGHLAGKQGYSWNGMQKEEKITTLVLITACSAIVVGLLSAYLIFYAGQ